MGRFGAAIAAGFWLALATCAMAGEASTPLTADPTVRRGVLANGLRYAVKQNATPERGISFRLAFEVGSLEEDEPERGAAHFIEHMAFRASRNFPEGELDAAFAPLGVAFGRDQNGFTSPDSTIYLLDLPRSDAAARALAFRWLRDVADGVRFDAASMDRERGVIQAEGRARRGADVLVVEAAAAFHGPELRVTARGPLGTPESPEAMTPAILEGFYRRWYRPDQAVLVVVGDFSEPAAIEAEIAAAFEDWQAGGPAPEPAPLSGPDRARGLDALTIADGRTVPGVSICRLTAPISPPYADLASLRALTKRALWFSILNERLSRLRGREPSIVNAALLIQQDLQEATKVCAEASTVDGGWEPALKAMQLELDRFSAEGPSETEFEQALAGVRAVQLGRITLAATRSSAALATEIAMRDLERTTVMAPEQALSAFNRVAEGLTEQQVLEAWRLAWSGGGPLLAVAAPTAPTREAVLAAWSRPAELSVVKTSAMAAAWAYGDLGPPSRVMRREMFDGPGFVRPTFENGVALNFKQTDARRGMALVRADFGAGREELGATTLFEADFVADSFVLGGLGRHSYAQLRTLFGDEAMTMDVRVSNRSFDLVARTFVSNLSGQLLLMSAYLRDPGFRDELDPKIPSVVANVYRTRAASPSAVVLDGVNDLFGGALGQPPAGELAAIRSRDFAALLRAPATRGALEVTLVGDLDEASATEMVATTFGTLPPRPAGPRRPYDGYRGFAPSEAPVRLTHAGPAAKAAVAVVWPTFVATSERRREKRALELLTAVFNGALRSDLRARLGKTYAPSVVLDSAEAGDQGVLYAVVETSPADLPLVEAEIRLLAKRLAAGELDERMLEAARAPLLTAAQEALINPQEIAWSIRSPAYNPEGADALAERARTLTDLTLAEVRQAAATWLAGPATTIIATPEPSK